MPNRLPARGRCLYHQIHPLKLLTDITSGFGSLVPLWRHELGLALIVMLVPPSVASALVLRYASLERERKSAFGHYVTRSMTRATEAVRLGGFIVMAVAAWKRSALGIALGMVVVVLGWLRGVLMPHPFR